MRCWVNDLTGLRLGQAELMGHEVDAFGLAELSFGEAELAVVFTQLLDGELFSFDAVAAFDGIEVLEAVDHDQGKEDGDGRGKQAHLADHYWIGRLNEAGVVKAAGEVELWGANAAAAERLQREEFRVLVLDPLAWAAACFEISCCDGRHDCPLLSAGNRDQGTGISREEEQRRFLVQSPYSICFDCRCILL